MKNGKSALKTAKKGTAKSSGRHRNKNIKKQSRERNFLKDVLGFRWLKKAMAGKTQEESLDLLDEWILKKRALTLFF